MNMNNKNIIIILILLVIGIIIILVYDYANKNIYSFVDIINRFFAKYCKDPPVLNPNDFLWSNNFRNNWTNIRDEYLSYANRYIIPAHKNINSIVSSCDKNNGWKTLYLRAYNKDTDMARYFPQTMNLINKCPCTLAFFSVLEPGAKLTPHVGIYKGVIRYHLGLIIPDDWQNCFINVNGNVLHWREGENIMFDDMFLHYVENNTSQPRVILFLDIKRDFHNVFINGLNSLFLKYIKSNDALKDTINNANSFAPK